MRLARSTTSLAREDDAPIGRFSVRFEPPGIEGAPVPVPHWDSALDPARLNDLGSLSLCHLPGSWGHVSPGP
jgi:hypothetical protein